MTRAQHKTPNIAPTKAGTVTKLLRRANGATLAEITSATGWQPHSARAFLSGLRKKGEPLLREKRRNGTTCYRIETATEDVDSSLPVNSPTPESGKSSTSEMAAA